VHFVAESEKTRKKNVQKFVETKLTREKNKAIFGHFQNFFCMY